MIWVRKSHRDRRRCTDRMRAIVADDNMSAQTYGMQRNTANASVAPAAEPVVLGGLGLGLRRQRADQLALGGLGQPRISRRGGQELAHLVSLLSLVVVRAKTAPRGYSEGTQRHP